MLGIGPVCDPVKELCDNIPSNCGPYWRVELHRSSTITIKEDAHYELNQTQNNGGRRCGSGDGSLAKCILLSSQVLEEVASSTKKAPFVSTMRKQAPVSR